MRCIGMIGVVAVLFCQKKDDQQADRNAECKTENVDKGKRFVPYEISQCDDQIIFQHTLPPMFNDQ
jgi:hypothetical protein